MGGDEGLRDRCADLVGNRSVPGCVCERIYGHTDCHSLMPFDSFSTGDGLIPQSTPIRGRVGNRRKEVLYLRIDDTIENGLKMSCFAHRVLTSSCNRYREK